MGALPTRPDIDPVLRDAIVRVLKDAGAAFAFIHGSRVRGTSRPSSDIDVAAWFSADPPQSYDVALAPGVDLLVLNRAPLELAGRIALEGVVLYDDDPPARVLWVATTRKIYADEEPRIRRSHAEFQESLRRGR